MERSIQPENFLERRGLTLKAAGHTDKLDWLGPINTLLSGHQRARKSGHMNKVAELK